MGIYLGLIIGNYDGRSYSDFNYENGEQTMNNNDFDPETEHKHEYILKSSYYYSLFERAGMDTREQEFDWMNEDKMGFSNLKKVKASLKTLKFRIDYNVDDCRKNIEAELESWGWDVKYNEGHEDRLDSVYEALCAEINLITELYRSAQHYQRQGIKVCLTQG